MKKTLCLLAAGTMLLSFNSFAGDRGLKKFQVTITNATQHHILTPPAVIAHSKKFHLFQVGMPASHELELLAENGANMPLVDSVGMMPHVYAVKGADAGIPPGSSLTIEIKAPWHSYFTVASMLASTNDAFVSTTTRNLSSNPAEMAYTMTYDAGTELNSEMCVDIPGPPCGGENMDTGEGEGFITIHSGIRGNSGEMDGITAEMFDWRGPTAVVSVMQKK